MTPKLQTLTMSAILLVSASSISHAQSTGQPAELEAIYACKAKSNPTDRLQCYDQAVGRFEAAQNAGSVVTVSKTQVENIERDAFGFNIPSLPSLGRLFGGSKKSAAAPKENKLTAPVKSTKPQTAAAILPKVKKSAELPAIKNTPIVKKPNPIAPQPSDIKSVELEISKTAEFGYNKTRFFFSNGQVWEQADSKKIRIPKVRNDTANTAKITKASLGSFLLRVNGKGQAIRVRRVR